MTTAEGNSLMARAEVELGMEDKMKDLQMFVEKDLNTKKVSRLKIVTINVIKNCKWCLFKSHRTSG